MAEIIDHAEVTEPLNVPDDESAALRASTRSRERQTTKRIAGAAAIVMLGTVFSRLVAIPRESLIAGLFGDAVVTNSYTIAENVLTIFLDLLLSGIASAVLVPVLSEYVGEDQREELGALVGKLLTLVVVGGGVMLLLLELGARGVAWAMTGVGGDGSSFDRELVVDLTRWILPALLLLGVASVLQSTLYALQRFTMPALSLAARNASVVLAMLLFGDALGVYSLIVGVLCGAVLLVCLQIPGFRGTSLRITPSLAWRDPVLRRIGTLYLPVFLGLLLNSWALIIDRNLASRTGEHGIAAMRFATQVQQLAVGIVVTAINVATLPRLSRAAAEDDQETFGRTLALGMRLVTTLVVPVTFGLIALAWPVVDLLFNHGKTTPEGAHLIRVALIGYAVGLPFIAWDQLLLFAFYARKNTRTPVIVGAISVGVLLACSFALILPFGVLGLVIANTAQFAFHAAVMFVIAKRRILAFDSSDLLRTILRTGAAALAMTAAVLLTLLVVRAALPGSGFAPEVARVVIPVAVGAVVYGAGVWALRIPEARILAETVRARLLRRGA
jgi:putative peptidoglycan lipid II flippase